MSGRGEVMVRPFHSNLAFQVYGRPLHPELFDVCAARFVRRPEFYLVVRITREGHFLSWDNGLTFLSEVTASTDQTLPGNGQLLNNPIRQEKATRLQLNQTTYYEANFQVEHLSPEPFLQIHREILADGSKRGLLYQFSTSNRFALSPLGFVQADFRPGHLFLSSFHTFPDEFTVIKTQSLIKFPG